MKKCPILIFSFVFILISSQAQTSLRGYVTLQSKNGKSAYPAQVKADGASDTDVNKEDGQFELNFDRKRPGEDVKLEVIRSGYEVVNEKDLYHRLPEEKNKQRPLKIYLCPIGEWQQYADQYYKVNLFIIIKRYEKNLANLQQKLKRARIEVDEYRQQAAQLDKELKIKIAQVQDLSEKFAKANLDDATARFKLALRLFAKGEIDSVLAILDEDKMKADLALVNKNINDSKEVKKKIIEEFMIKAKAHILRSEWEAANQTYQLVIKEDSTNFENLLEYAVYLQKQNQINRSQVIYERARKLARTAPDTAIVLNSFANLQTDKGDFINAARTFKEAIKIYKRLSQENPSTFEPKLASTLNNLGTLYQAENDFINAYETYQRALEIRKQLAKKDLQIFGLDFAVTLKNMGALYLEKNELQNAKKAFLKALEVHNQLLKRDTSIAGPNLAGTLNNLGILYQREGALSKAYKVYLEAIKIREQLAKKNPQAYEPDLAQTLQNLASLYQQKGDFQNALQSYQKALKIFKQLARDNPMVFEPDLATVLHNLAILYTDKNDFQNAQKTFPQVFKIKELLAEKDPFTFNLDLGQSYLAFSFYCLKRLQISQDSDWQTEGIQYLMEAIELLTVYPQDFEPLTKLIPQIADLYLEISSSHPLLIPHKDSIRQLVHAITQEEKEWDKVSHQLDLIEIYEKALAQEPDDETIKGYLANAYGHLARYQIFSRKFSKAEVSARRAISLHSAASWVYKNLALSLLFQGKYDTAYQIYADRKGKQYGQQRIWTQVFLEDLDALEAEDIIHPYMIKIRRFLKE